MAKNETKQEDLDLLDILLDENNDEPISLFDEDDREVKFEQVAVIPDNDKIYAILKPIDELEGVADDEAIVFLADYDEDGNTVLVVEKDEDTAIRVFDKYYQLLDEAEKKENELKMQSENITEDKPVIKPIVEKKPSEDIDEIIKKLEKTEVPENNDEPDGFTQEINLKDEPNTMLNVDKDSEVINNSVSDDDDYLDNFFDD